MEFLKDVLGEDLYAQVAEKLNGNESIKLANLADGKYIPKDKFDAERTGAKALKTQIEELNNRIATLQNETAGADALKVQLAQIQSEIAKKDAELKSQRMDYSIMDSARKHKAKDADLVARMIDKSKLTEAEDGFTGLDEQFEELAKTYSYMFESEQPKAGGFDANRVPNQNDMSESSIMNQMIRSAAR